jgi:hypothetical protein
MEFQIVGLSPRLDVAYRIARDRAQLEQRARDYTRLGAAYPQPCPFCQSGLYPAVPSPCPNCGQRTRNGHPVTLGRG